MVALWTKKPMDCEDCDGGVGSVFFLATHPPGEEYGVQRGRSGATERGVGGAWTAGAEFARKPCLWLDNGRRAAETMDSGRRSSPRSPALPMAGLVDGFAVGPGGLTKERDGPDDGDREEIMNREEIMGDGERGENPFVDAAGEKPPDSGRRRR